MESGETCEGDKPDIVLLCEAASDFTWDIAVEKKFMTLVWKSNPWCGVEYENSIS